MKFSFTKKVFLSVVLACSCSFSFAQFTWGVKSGVNVSMLRVRTVNVVYGVLPAYNIGLFTETKIAPRTSILAELSFSKQGYSQSGSAGNFHANYFSLPILGAYSFARNWQVVLGAEMSYMVRQYQQSHDYYSNDIAYFNRFDVALAGGVRYKLNKKWGFEVRYLYGLTTLEHAPSDPGGQYFIVPEEYTPRNMVFQGDVFFAIR